MPAMARRIALYLFAAAALLSLLVCAAAIGLRLDSALQRPGSRLIRLGGDVRLASVGSVCFLSNREVPYTGSILSLREPVTESVRSYPSPHWPVVIGIVVRPASRTWTWWTLRIDLDGLIGLTAVLPVVWCSVRAIEWRRRARGARLGLCLRCGYDLRLLKGKCPDCGEPIPINAIPENSTRG